MSPKASDKEARILRLAVLKSDFLLLHPGKDCVVQVVSLPIAPCR